jgi:hypothetical protein
MALNFSILDISILAIIHGFYSNQQVDEVFVVPIRVILDDAFTLYNKPVFVIWL